MEGVEKDHYFSLFMNGYAGLIILFCVHTWFVQKDLITVAIKNHMIKRQQTQLHQYFTDQLDLTFILSEKGEILFMNATAKKLFETLKVDQPDGSELVFSKHEGDETFLSLKDL